MSVPYSPPGPVDLLSALQQMGVTTFYMQYFQTPGVAEAELQADVAATTATPHLQHVGRWRGRRRDHAAARQGYPAQHRRPAAMPAWVDAEDLAYTVAEFERTGFRGGLNWYRSLRLSWELLAPWRGAVIHQPSLFIGGDRDDVLKFPNSRASIDSFGQTLPGLRGCHILPGAGHWVQRERAAAVNDLLLAFLRGL